MKRILLSFTLFSTTLSYSQITLDQNDFSNGGDTIRMSQATDPTLNFASTGTNYSWDFSNLQPTGQVVRNYRPSSQLSFLSNVYFGTFAPTQYHASYFIESSDIPVAQLTSVLPITITDIFQFSRVTTDSITSIGYSMVVNGTEIPFKSDTIEKRYDFPVQFGNTTDSRGYTSMDMNPVYDAKWLQYRTHTSEVDGWGSITTPYGTFDALRIKHEIHEIDSIYYGGFGIWIPLALPTSYQYEWWTNGKKEPILRVSTSVTLGNESITAIEYRDSLRDLTAGFNELTLDYSIFPNPATNSISIISGKSINQIEIQDVAGKTIRNIQLLPSNKVEINTSELLQGIYYIKVYADNEISTKSFVRE